LSIARDLMKRIFFLSAFLPLLLSGCRHDTFAEARVRYAGDPDTNGCGYILEFAGESFHPVDLDPQFQQDSLELGITFRYLETVYTCGIPEDSLREIEILEAEITD